MKKAIQRLLLYSGVAFAAPAFSGEHIQQADHTLTGCSPSHICAGYKKTYRTNPAHLQPHHYTPSRLRVLLQNPETAPLALNHEATMQQALQYPALFPTLKKLVVQTPTFSGCLALFIAQEKSLPVETRKKLLTSPHADTWVNAHRHLAITAVKTLWSQHDDLLAQARKIKSTLQNSKDPDWHKAGSSIAELRDEAVKRRRLAQNLAKKYEFVLLLKKEDPTEHLPSLLLTRNYTPHILLEEKE